MGLKEFLKKRRERAGKLKEIQEEIRLNEMARQRMKTPQERDLERFLEEERQKKIKMQVQKFKEKRKGNMLKGSLGDTKNIFKGHKNILHSRSMNFLGEKKMIGGSMFFK